MTALIPTPCLRCADKALTFVGYKLQRAGLVVYAHVVARDPDLPGWIEESKRRLPPPPPPEIAPEDAAPMVRYFSGALDGKPSGSFTARYDGSVLFIRVYIEGSG